MVRPVCLFRGASLPRNYFDITVLLLNLCPQPRNGLVPLIRNSCEVIFSLRNRAGPDGETALPASTPPVDNARMLQHLQVLGNSLAC